MISKQSPFEELARNVRAGLGPPWLRQSLRQFDASLRADADVAKGAIRTAKITPRFERSLSPYEIDEIARAVADQMGRKRRRRGDAVIDTVEVEGVARVAKETAALPAIQSRKKCGRKAKYRLLQQEMQGRADAGTIRETWDEEKKALRAWMSRLPADQRPAPKTIYNRHRELRATYDALVAGRNVPLS